MIFHAEKIVSTESVLLNVQIDADLERYDSYRMTVFIKKGECVFLMTISTELGQYIDNGRRTSPYG